MTARRAHHKKNRFLSSQEVKQKSGERWLEYEQIKASFTPAVMQNFLRPYIGDFLAAKGVDIEALKAEGSYKFVADFFDTFFICFSESKEPLDAFDEFQKLLLQVKGELASEAVRRHAMIDHLKQAGARWREIAVLLTDDWNSLSADKQAARVAELRENHTNYRKKYPASALEK